MKVTITSEKHGIVIEYIGKFSKKGFLMNHGKYIEDSRWINAIYSIIDLSNADFTSINLEDSYFAVPADYRLSQSSTTRMVAFVATDTHNIKFIEYYKDEMSKLEAKWKIEIFATQEDARNWINTPPVAGRDRPRWRSVGPSPKTLGKGELRMDCELRVIPDKKIAVSSFTGPIETSDRYRNRDRTLAFCKERGISEIIVDTRGQVSHSTTVEILAFAKDLEPLATEFKIAFVRDPDGDDIKFMENVAEIRGCECRSFFTFKEAEQWLTPQL